MIIAFFLLLLLTTANCSHFLSIKAHRQGVKQRPISKVRAKPTPPPSNKSDTKHPVLGNGSMGTVFKVKRSDDTFVAVKVVHKASFVNGKVRKVRRWTDNLKYLTASEICALHRLSSSPHVIDIYDVHEDHGSVYLSLELCQHGSLDDLMAQEYTVTPEVAVYVARQLVKGLLSIHRLKVIHCDIKPGNILIMSGGVLKYADFGGSLVLRNSQDTMVTGDENTDQYDWGSPLYQSPELLGAESGPTEQSDIWSLGVTIFEFITGDYPFGAEKLTTKEHVLKAATSLKPTLLPEEYSMVNELTANMLIVNVQGRALPTLDDQSDAVAQKNFADTLPPLSEAPSLREKHISTLVIPEQHTSFIRDHPDIQAAGVPITNGAPFAYKSDDKL